MSGQYSILLVDIGNSRIKYAWCNNQGEYTQIEHAEAQRDLVRLIQNATEVWAASVKSQPKNEYLQQAANAARIQCHWVQTESERFGIQCAYQHYSTLGVDRWLSVIAVSQITSQPAAIISFGTAITCDFVHNNEHLGGWIAPGFSLMRDGIVARADNVFADNTFPEKLEIGLNTQSCVNMGCLAAAQGIYMAAKQQLALRGQAERIFVTGGGKSILSSIQDQKIEMVDNLVIQGLAVYVKRTKRLL